MPLLRFYSQDFPKWWQLQNVQWICSPTTAVHRCREHGWWWRHLMFLIFDFILQTCICHFWVNKIFWVSTDWRICAHPRSPAWFVHTNCPCPLSPPFSPLCLICTELNTVLGVWCTEHSACCTLSVDSKSTLEPSQGPHPSNTWNLTFSLHSQQKR